MSRSRSTHTVRPLTREQWAALDPANRYRACVDLEGGKRVHGMHRPDRATAEADLAELVEGLTGWHDRSPSFPQVTGSSIEDKAVTH